MTRTMSHIAMFALLAALAADGGGCVLSFGGPARDLPEPVAPTGPTAPAPPSSRPAAANPIPGLPQTRPVQPASQQPPAYDAPRIDVAGGQIIEAKLVQVNDEQLTLTELLRPLRADLAAVRAADLTPAEFDAAVRPRLRQALRGKVITMLLLQRAKQVLETQELDMISRRVVDQLAKDRQDLAGEGRPPVSRQDFEEQLRRRGTDIFEYRKSLSDRFTIETLIRKEMLPEINVRPSEALQYFQRVRAEQYGNEPTVIRRMIVFYCKDDAEKQAKRKLAEAALAELQAGKSFAEVAKARSEGIYADAGGLWPDPVRKSSMVNAAEAEALFALKPGQHTGVIESAAALTILYCEKRNEPVTFEQVQDEIFQRLREQKMSQHYDEYVQRLWDKTFPSEEAYLRATEPFLTAAVMSLMQK